MAEVKKIVKAIIKNKSLEEAIKQLDLSKVDIIESKGEVFWDISQKKIPYKYSYEKYKCEKCGNDKFYFFEGEGYTALLICTKCKDYIPLDLL